MGKLKLTFHDISYYQDEKAEKDKAVKGDIYVSTEQDTCKLYIDPTGENSEAVNYQLSLIDLRFHKKMYQPTEVVAKLQIAVVSGTDSSWKRVSRKSLQALLLNKRTSLVEMIPDSKGNYSDDQYNTIGDDYYVHQIETHYKPKAMYCILRIYSLDKLLTLQKASRTFVSKKLGADILATEITNYKKVWDTNSDEKKRESVKCDTDNMQVLAYSWKKSDQETKKTEHIFPYLVQYNESFYDMLARTANRWGEFLFYEDGKLQVGHKPDQTPTDKSDAWQDIEYCDETNNDAPVFGDNTKYALEAPYDTNVLNSPLTKSPNIPFAILGCAMDAGMDIWLMNKFASFLGNTKSIPEWLGENTFEEVFAQLETRLQVKNQNNAFDKVYFDGKEQDEHFNNDKDSWNPFSELNSVYDGTKYAQILLKEVAAAHGAVRINFDTTYPNVKLGQVIKLYKDTTKEEKAYEDASDNYIVVEMTAQTSTDSQFKLVDGKRIEQVTTSVEYHVVAIPQDKTDKKFYPTMLPTGHIRTSGPQVATVTDADDPLAQNRVRIMFPWQNIVKDKDTKKMTDDTKKASSPWLVYASSAASDKNGILGRHNEGDIVLVNFAYDNVERPFIAGGLTTEGNTTPKIQAVDGVKQNVVLTSPGGHALKLNDGTGSGFTAFFTGLFLPNYKLVTTFFPSALGLDWFKKTGLKTSSSFEGGFDLADKYGIYKISGSTDKRNITIKSPWGDVKIDAFTGISINAPNGDVSIKGKNVTIEAGNNLTLTSGTNVNYKLAQKKDKWGGKGGNIATFALDAAKAFAKKLTGKLKVLDLSVIRAAYEIIVRPMEGALTLKSNRFLKLEAGKGRCDYPRLAYKDKATADKMRAAKEKADLRPGLALSASIVELIGKCGTIAEAIDTKYIQLYNGCVSQLRGAQTGLLQVIEDGKNFVNGADVNAAFCKTYDEMKEQLWKQDKKKMKEEDLGFKDNYKTGGAADVDADCLDRCIVHNYIVYHVGDSDETAKKRIIAKRKEHREKILLVANRLHTAILELQKIQKWTGTDIVQMMGNLTQPPIDGYADAIGNAFIKSKIDTNGVETFYYKPDQTLENNIAAGSLNTHRNMMRRRATILMLESLGFKDEWRNTGDNGQPVPRPWSDADMQDEDKWPNYVNSLNTVPKLSAAKTKLLQKALDALKETGQDMVDWKNIKGFKDTWTENHAWAEGKKGGILFSNGSLTYNLGKDISTVDSPARENLKAIDDAPNANNVNDFLTALRGELAAI